MNFTSSFVTILLLFSNTLIFGQNFSFNYATNGRRVCLVTSEVEEGMDAIRLLFHDSLTNTNEPIYVNRRALGTQTWTEVATALAPGTGHWIDNNVAAGDIWEYQVRRHATWTYQSVIYDAIGYTIGCFQSDNVNYHGQMILLVSNDIPTTLSEKYIRLKKEITADGWLINEILVPRATSWDSGNEVISIRNQVGNVYSNAPSNDKPKVLFILGHVPLPRSGSTNVTAPDGHDQSKGARGCDAYYADVDGVFTDTATFNPGNLSSPLAINLPGDYRWDQDFFPSDIEMAFGRIDFADITEISTSEFVLLENYLDRLSNYKNVATGFDMGNKTAYYFGYDNSNDGSFRSLPNIAAPGECYQNVAGTTHNQWVQENGPFKIYMQNKFQPSINDWQTYGMNATVYSSDQSYWGFGDVPQPAGNYGRIRTLLGINSKCLIALWTTTGTNIFHQACTGMAFGLAVKEIMNHTLSNNYLEKPSQSYDTPDWWNRTHFAFYGDPTISLYQVAPVTNVTLTENGSNSALMQWTASSDVEVIGYHIFESDTEFGKFERITTSPLIETSYIISSYQTGHWYMVKPVKAVTSGCGTFLHAGLGSEIQGDIILTTTSLEKHASLQVFPIPAHKEIQLQSTFNIKEVSIYSILGEVVINERFSATPSSISVSSLASGVYFLKCKGDDERVYSSKIIVNH